jgi:hypothetical protein
VSAIDADGNCDSIKEFRIEHPKLPTAGWLRLQCVDGNHPDDQPHGAHWYGLSFTWTTEEADK